MAQHDVIILNEVVPQLQEPQAGDSYRMPADVEIVGDLVISGSVDGIDVAATAAIALSATQPGDNLSTLTNDSGFQANVALASQAEAEAGVENTKTMTAFRVAQALATLDQDVLNNFGAISNPLTTDDTNDGYSVGSLWANTSNGSVFVCLDAAINIAIWTEVTNAALASQAEAEGGTNNTKTMTPLRVAQAIAVFSSGLLNKYDGVADPLNTNDVNDGYSVGSIWMNQNTNEVFRCIDNSAAAAVWIKTSLTIDELATVALSGDSDDLVEGIVQLLMTVAERSKLAGIEAGATADQSDAEIRTAVEAATDSNVFTDADHSKLDGLEAGATGDQTGAEIKIAYEAEADTNAFDDAAVSKLAAIEASATADQTGAEIKTLYEAEVNAFTDTLFTKLGAIEASATADQTGAEIKAAYELEVSAFTDALFTKLNGIETGATADQSDAEIKTAYENNADTNAFSDAEQTKLTGIEASATADQTAGEIKIAYEAYVAKVGVYTVAVTDLTVNCTSGTFALTLGDAIATPYRIHHLKNSGSGVITIDTTTAQTIDGGASGSITLNQYDNLSVQSDGANWIIL